MVSVAIDDISHTACSALLDNIMHRHYPESGNLPIEGGYQGRGESVKERRKKNALL